MRCLITGVDGFLGANLAKRLLADGHEVTGAALNRKGGTSLEALSVSCRVEYGDVLDSQYVARVIAASEAQWVFHLAAVSIVRVAQSSPARTIATNLMGTVNVLEACRSQPAVRAVLVASSDKAYGDHGGLPYVETMTLHPHGVYETSKAMADQVARMYARLYSVPAIVVRCANLFGPGDLNWSRLVPGSCRRAFRHEFPEIHAGQWDSQREWLDVESAADAYLWLAERGTPGEAYNAGSGEVATAGQVATMVAETMGSPLPAEGEPLGVSEIPSQQLDSSKLRALGWRPNGDLEWQIERTCNWYHTHLRRTSLRLQGVPA